MDEGRKNFGIEITRKSINMHTDNHKRAVYIEEQFHKKYGGEWTTFIAPKYTSGSCFTYYNLCYINFTIGEFEVIIYKASYSPEDNGRFK